MYESPIRDPLVTGGKDYHQISEDICAPLEARKFSKMWYFILWLSISAMCFGGWALYITITQGIGAWGVNNTVCWGWGIINFVWWIGIGHAGTAFSIFLLVLRQRWRTSINRSAEAMTVFAILCASLYPIAHMGRIWVCYFVFPYPNARGPLWVNFNSPLLWDVFAIGTYVLASSTFWYLGMLPDFATIRDRATTKIRKSIYGFLSFGWDGSARTWLRFESLSSILAGLAAALVVSVHSIISMDFATSVIYGWHTTIFPPYFVVGAIFSGFAMVLTLMIIVRRAFNFQDYVTNSHLNAITKILVFISLIMGTGYTTEIFLSWYSGNEYEFFVFFHNRISGDYALPYWTMIVCNAIIPQLFWFKKIRKNLTIVFIISLIINIGMWFERFVIVVTSLSKDYLPANWWEYKPTVVEMGIFIGTLGFFVFGLLLFLRYLPVIAISEVKGVLKPGKKPEGH
ncbi:MAG: hydrogenase [Bacteroidetes bacterium RIFCSPLOWO2_02_FULL_36_8]|nr:MAG: hydrogenase [Bacteroidetes bacterium RIFCSPLOWO2_02_FULL_36_8]OFY70252.1 MAG: hydrogenase [Bacteroidetes bacterium RIFCSPLOWO2_12_FULL_37_12]